MTLYTTFALVSDPIDGAHNAGIGLISMTLRKGFREASTVFIEEKVNAAIGGMSEEREIVEERMGGSLGREV